MDFPKDKRDDGAGVPESLQKSHQFRPRRIASTEGAALEREEVWGSSLGRTGERVGMVSWIPAARAWARRARRCLDQLLSGT
jgi:hypothetical protein